MNTRNYDDSIIEHWRLEPRWTRFEIDEPALVEQAPSLWKDLAFASVVALVLGVVAAAMLG